MEFVDNELARGDVDDVFSGVCRKDFSGVCCRVVQVELETFSFSLLFLLNLVGFKKSSIGNSSGVFTLAQTSGEIYSESASQRFVVGMGFSCSLAFEPIDENPQASDPTAPVPGHVGHAP